MSVMNIFWIIILIIVLIPIFGRKMLQSQRLGIFKKLEKKRKSRVIALIHRQETMKIFGLPIFRIINIEDSEQVLRAIRMTDDSIPIDI